MGGENTSVYPPTNAASGEMGDNGDAGMVRIPGIKGNVTGDTAGAVGIGTALSIKTKSLSDGKKGKSYSDSLALGGKKPVAVKWSAFGLPPGITLDASNGKLSGTPSATGSFPVLVLVVAKSGTGAGSASYTVKVSK